MIYLVAGRCNACGEPYYRPVANKLEIAWSCNCQDFLGISFAQSEDFHIMTQWR